MKIGVFCSANSNIDADFFKLTDEIGRWMGQQGHTVVYGGADLGLMQCVAKATKQAGGHTIGVVPAILEQNGHVSQYNDEVIPCDSLNERIQIMIRQSDAFIALPGGIGTLDEIFAVAASRTIGYHQKPLILYNMKGFWDATISMLDNMQKKGMIRKHWSELLKLADNCDDLQKALSR